MAELERDLRALGALVAFPETPDVAGRVVARLPERRPSRRPRRAFVVAFAALLVAVVAALAVPQARTAILEFFHIRGATVERVPTLPETPVRPIDLGLGPEVPLEEAQDRAAYKVVDPSFLGEPDEIHYDPSRPGGQTAFLWRDDEGEPTLLLTQFRADVDTAYIEKMAGPGTTIELLTVNGEQAIWLTGTPHAYVYRDARGEIREEAIRLAGTVLLWQRGVSLMRLEGDLTREEALEIAESLG
jgi:hypothetical protein